MGSLQDPSMCLSTPKAPTINQTVAPPPSEAPAPLALPDGESMSVASLRLSGRNTLRTRKGPASPSGGASATPTGGTSGNGSSNSGGSSGGTYGGTGSNGGGGTRRVN